MHFTPRFSRKAPAFTLIEVIVSMAIIILLLVMLVQVTDSTRKTWTYTTGKIEQFKDAREAFDSMTRKISQATLNTYWDYFDASGNTLTSSNSTTFVPAKYGRQSELRYISGPAQTLTVPASTGATNPTHAAFFQAPLGYTENSSYSGLKNLLNTWGYYVEYGSDANYMPAFLKNILPARNRFRLMEMTEPTENMVLYQKEIGVSGYKAKDWFTTSLSLAAANRPSHPLADNVIALVILPKLSAGDMAALGLSINDVSLAPSYLYDSTGSGMLTTATAYLNPTNQLPPVVQVTVVAIDELSAGRMTDTDNKALAAKLATLFSNATKFAADLKLAVPAVPIANDPSLEAYLISKRISYRIFTSNVSLKAAKWSRAQTN